MTTTSIYITKADHEKLSLLIRNQSPERGRLPEHLQRLSAELDRAELRESADIPEDVVTLDSQVKVRYIDSGETDQFILVYPNEASIDEGKISILSPLGTALLGYRAGDIFEWSAPGGICRARVESLLFQPEREGKA